MNGWRDPSSPPLAPDAPSPGTVATSPSAGPTGSIYDLGYRGYDGPRLGRRHAFATLLRQSLRAIFGLGRPARAKLLPLFCLAIPALVAVIFVAIRAFASRFGITDLGAIPGHPEMAGAVGGLATLLVAVQAPELLGRDVRYRVLTLWFSRALLRIDYAAAKLAALSIAVGLLLLLPQLILGVGTVLLTADVVSALGRELGQWPAIFASSAIYALATAGVALVVAAYIARRAYATAVIFGVFIVPGIVAAVVLALDLGSGSRFVVLVDIGTVLDAANAWLFGVATTGRIWEQSGLPTWAGLGAAVVIALGAGAIVIQRYRTIPA